MLNKILVTGGAGFIGSNFVRMMLDDYPGLSIVNLDLLTYAGNLENLSGLEDNPKYSFVKGDVADRDLVGRVMDDGIDGVVHFAAESHVDRSITEPGVFLMTNILGTQVLLEAALNSGVDRYVQVSTDEVYGALGPEGLFTEETNLKPNSPYSASKASADLLVRSYYKTFGLPVSITRCSNNYGPYQFPEKMIPLFVSNAMEGKPLPVYGDGMYVRDWIHVLDHCRAVDRVLRDGRAGEVYNIGGNAERTNLDITNMILDATGKPRTMIEHVKDRPGHDRRYAIDFSKIRAELDWKPAIALDDGLADTIAWYVENRAWWEKIKSGEYRDYYRKMYVDR